MSQWYVFIKYSFADNEMHQPASEKAKVETKLRFHAGRLDAGVLWAFMSFIWLMSFIGFCGFLVFFVI